MAERIFDGVSSGYARSAKQESGNREMALPRPTVSVPRSELRPSPKGGPRASRPGALRRIIITIITIIVRRKRNRTIIIIIPGRTGWPWGAHKDEHADADLQGLLPASAPKNNDYYSYYYY